MADAFRVLHVDDEPRFVDVVAEFLTEADDRLSVATETSATAALDRLAEEAVDCVVSDYRMPEMDGLTFLDHVREDHPDLPFVLFTGHGSEEIASEAISRGVTDYLQKGTGTDQYALLANRVTNAIERREVERKLHRSEAHLRQDQSVATLGSWWTEVASDDLYWSDEVYEIFGIAPSENGLDHEAFLSYVHPEDREFVESKWRAALSGQSYDIEHRIVVDGETKWVHERAEVEFDAEGNPERAVGVVQDITERKERQRRLEAANRRLQAVLDTVDAGIFMKDFDGTYRLCNDAARAMMDLDPETEVVGRTDDDLFPESVAERFRDDDRRVLDAGETRRIEERVSLPGGERTHLAVKSPVYDESGEPSGVCAVVTDVTDRVDGDERE
ncbi:MAG: PAS domain-containing protein [Haloplanus sp.]